MCDVLPNVNANANKVFDVALTREVCLNVVRKVAIDWFRDADRDAPCVLHPA